MSPFYWIVHLLGWVLWGIGVAQDSTALIVLAMVVWVSELLGMYVYWRFDRREWPWS